MRSEPFGWISLVGVALLAISVACGGGGGGSSTVPTSNIPTITSFVANPSSIHAGLSTTLIGNFGNGGGVITPGNLIAASGSGVTVWPTGTTTYTLTVTNSYGAQTSHSATVTVVPPSISSFTANPSTITAGGSTQLLGSFADGTGVIIPGDVPVTSGNSISVTPDTTTVYTLIVTNEAGISDARSTTVQVVAPSAPIITSFVASPTSIISGESTDLTGTFRNGTGVITPGNLSVTSGSAVTVQPTTTTTYTLTVTNPAGASTTQTATVSVEAIHVLAGASGTAGSSNGTGSSARFNQPFSITRDGSGNLYVADTNNNTIRKITPAGVVSTLAGTPGVQGSADGAGTAASFYSPRGVAVDASGNVYVADMGNNSIRKITPAGVVSTLATGFSNPFGVAVDATGTVYVADTYHQTICKVTPSGTVSILAGMTGVFGDLDATGTAARFYLPQGLAVDASGYVYVADTFNDAVRKISPTGVVTTVAGSNSLCTGVALDGAGNIYVAGVGITKLSPAGQILTWVGFGTGVQGVVVDPVTGTCFGVGNDAVWEIPAVFF